MILISENNRLLTFVSSTLLCMALTACGGGGGSGGGQVNGGGNGGIADTTKPVITLTGSATVSITQGDSFNDAGATANDNVDGDISVNIAVGGDTVDTTTVGSYTITYNVSDAAGNSATQVTRTVTVSAVISNGIMSFVAYKVDDDLTNNDRIYTVRGNGTNHRDLHPNIPTGGEISEFSWAPVANGRIAYLGDVDTDTINELYSVEPSSNLRVKLNGNLPSGGDVIEYQWSPDGTKIAYRANQDDFGKIELYVVDSDGQNRVKVNTTLVGGGNVEEFSWSPANSHVFYRADAAVNDQFNWHVATANGSTSNQVNVNLGAGESIVSPRWSPLGNYIDYIHDLAGNADVDLYIYKLSDLSNSKMDTFTFANTQKYDWSDSELHFAIGQNLGGMLVHSFDGSSVVNVLDIQAFEFIPSSENLVTTKTIVISQFNHDQALGVYASDGSVINSEFVYKNGAGGANNFSFSPDAQKILFKFNGNSAPDDLYVYDTSTNSAINLDAAVSSAPDISEVTWSQDSTRILVNRQFSIKSLISPNGSGLVDLASSTSSSLGLLSSAQWVGNEIYLVRNTGVSPVSGDILKVDKNGQTPIVIANSQSTHAFHCTGLPSCNVSEFKSSNNASFITYRRVGSIVSSAGDDLHTINVDGTGDVKISIELDPSLGLRISEYSIQPVI
ncbi:MAG: DUF5011 domain-containing protein [Gammaproteobacteria bacterium]|nr:DUF5011 domain-containing protein [Gammaproteobacteria bacterium]